MTGPGLSGNAPTAVRHRGSHVQIIASAGSGKTEVVPQRIRSDGELLRSLSPSRLPMS